MQQQQALTLLMAKQLCFSLRAQPLGHPSLPLNFSPQEKTMALDSDINNADSQLYVEFYTSEKDPYKGKPFIKIVVPGDKTTVIDQPVRDDHKERFPRQWLHFQMQSGDGPVIGTPLKDWFQDRPDELNDNQLAELQILKFQTVEQVATASDNQLQRIGMGGVGLRERARNYLLNKNQKVSSGELDKTRLELAELKAQMAMLLEQRKPGRPRKNDVIDDNVGVSSANN
jgi:hypothetical protein